MGWMAIVGAAIAAGGQVQAGQAAGNTAEYNAAVAQQEAEFQRQRTESELAFQREEVERIIGKARVVGGGSGVAGGTGITESILKDTLKQGILDRQMIKTQGAINIWRAQTQSNLLGSEASQFRTAGWMQGGATLLGGLSKYDYRGKKR
jgi:hypothetical protein